MYPGSSSSSKSTANQGRNCLKIEQRTKKRQQQCYRNPLKDFNATIVNSNSSSNSSSIEAPRGCLRFFLSHSSSSSSNSRTPFIDGPVKMKSLAKTSPKSAPNLSKPAKRGVLQKPISQQGEKVGKNTPCLYQWQSGRKPSSRNGSKCKTSSVLDTGGRTVNKLPSGSERRVCDVSDVNLTPLSKIVSGSGLGATLDKKGTVGGDDEKLSNNSGNKSKTPPIQASVSPEIQKQCGSSVIATSATPACYGAGYVVSGIADKRKCRSRGLLTVGDNNVLDFGAAKAIDRVKEDRDHDHKENVVRVDGDSRRVSIMPLPAEASMHWLLTPCNQKDEVQKENSGTWSCGIQLHSPSSSFYHDEFGLDLCNDSNSRRSVSTSAKRRSTSSCSPTEVPQFQGGLGTFHDNVVISSSPNCTPSCKATVLEKETTCHSDFDGENSLLSLDTLGSGNVIQTPQSDSSSDRCAGFEQLKPEAGQKQYFGSEIDLLAESIQMSSLSSKGYESIWDSNTSSFQFDCAEMPSNSVDLSLFQKVLDDQVSWMSTSTLGNVSQSQMRISWREGLVSRIFEMDEFDSCRYLSDEEEDVSGCYNDQLKSCQNSELNVDDGNYEILKNDFSSTEYVDIELGDKEKAEERIPQISCSCAESISTDGGSLVASGDSDWTLCYKNHLFRG